jgi:uncharacterized peroxidase-related enzyme
MPRVTPIRAGDAPAELRPFYERAPRLDDPDHVPGPGLFLSQVEMLAHTPGILRGLAEVYRWLAEEGTVARKFHELAIVTVSNRNRCTYCVSHHTPFALAAGATAAQVEAIATGAWRERPSLFDDAEAAVVEWAEQITVAPWRAAEAQVARLRRHFTEAQIVELTARATLCSFWNKFNDALGLALEPGVTEVAPGAPLAR